MAVDKRTRAAQHLNYFYPHELAALRDACAVLGKDLGDLSRRQARDLITLFYNSDGADRSEHKALARLRLCNRIAFTFCRHEFGFHRHAPGFTDEVKRLVDGPNDDSADERSIMSTLRSVLHVAERG